jgi:Domain of unknown function (DUF5666)
VSSFDDTLATGPSVEDDDEWVEAPPPARRRWLSPLTLVLLLALVATGAFLLGVEVQKSAGAGGTAQAAGGGGGGAAAGRTRLFDNSGAPSGGTGTLGQVKTIQGGSLYVTSFTGNVVKVKTTPATRFTKTEQLTVQGVKPGDTVVVQGTQAKDGSITATSVSLGGGRGFGGVGQAPTGSSGGRS